MKIVIPVKDDGQLARKLYMKIGELDSILRELKRAGKVRLTEIKGKLAVELRRD